MTSKKHIDAPPADPPSLFEQYKQLAALEIEVSKLRHTTFTAILAVSFLLPGLALRPEVEARSISILGHEAMTLSGAVFLLGFLIFAPRRMPE